MGQLTVLHFFFAVFSLPLVSAQYYAVAYNGSAIACQKLQTVLNNVVFLPWERQYQALSTENWSATAWKRPSCIVQPINSTELQKVVRILMSGNVQFAIRSGGHMPSPFAANIDDGVLIDVSQFNQVDYDAASNMAVVGAGQKWGNVYQHLDHYNVTVVGGRVLDVGVGGLILGSGLSYLSDLYGLACDNVVNFEVVLADGSIANVNASSSSDLFWALKGGSNNFGIVTAFTLSTYPIHQVWGGIKTYSLDQLPALFSAMYEYQSVPEKDPYANLMFQAFTTNASVGGVLNIVYLKPEISPAAFASFYSIPTTGDTTKIQTLTQMMSGQRVPDIPRWDWFATSFLPSPTLYQKIAHFLLTAPQLSTISSITSGTLALGLQPISSSLVRAGRARGGNALGLKQTDQTWFALDAGWWDPSADMTVHNATRAMHDTVEQESKREGNYVEYTFMNDASWDQDVIGHYGEESVKRLEQIQRTYDPELSFQRLVRGGFKLPQGR